MILLRKTFIRNCLCLFMLLANCESIYSQTNTVPDSLLQLLKNVKQDSAGVELYLSAGASVETSNVFLAITYYSQAIQISRKLNNKRALAKSFIYYGSAMNVAQKNDSGFYYNQQALQIAKETKDTLYIGICLINAATVLQQTGKSDEALEYLLEGQKLLENVKEFKLKNYQTQVYSSLQTIYTSREEHDKAIVFGKKVLSLADELGDNSSKCAALLNLSVSMREKKQIDEAKKYTAQAKQLATEMNDTRFVAAAILCEASLLEKEGAYASILPLVEKSLSLSRECGAFDMELISLIGVGTCWLQFKDFAKAEQFSKLALDMSRQQQNKKEEANVLRLLSRIEYAKGNVNEGAAYERTAAEITTQYTNEVISFRSANLEKKYETEKKNNQILQLTKDKQINTLWNYVLAGSLATLLIISLLGYRTYQQKQKLQQQQIAELEKEKQLLAAEAVLKGQAEERTRLAKDLHDGLGGMLSGIKHSFNTMKENLILTPENAQAFERSMKMLDSSIKELRMVAHNLMPESLVRFGLDTALKDFCESITGSGKLMVRYHSFGTEELKLEKNTEITLYRVIQELLNNSMKHAQATEAIVQLQKEGSLLTVTVEDNGKGFDTHLLETSKGIGWSNIKNRVEYLKGAVAIVSAPGKGTGVTIELPV